MNLKLIKLNFICWLLRRRFINNTYHWYLVKTDKIGNYQWGNYLRCDIREMSELRIKEWLQHAKKLMIKQARAVLPCKYWDKIEIIIKDSHLTKTGDPLLDWYVSVGWKFTPIEWEQRLERKRKSEDILVPIKNEA